MAPGSSAAGVMAKGMSGPERMPAAYRADSDSGYQQGESGPAAPGYNELMPLGEVTDEPKPSAAVGSVFQSIRPLAVQSLQRTVDFGGAVPAGAGHSPSRSNSRETNGDGVVYAPAPNPIAPNPVALTLAAPAAEPRAGEATGPAEDSSGTIQRLSLPEGPDHAARAATGQGSTEPGISAASLPEEASQAPQVGTASPATEHSTAGKPGSALAVTPDQLEELAKRLAGPLIRRIKAEMLLDRERRGLRTDSN
ncbi:hypothetical protein [Arthrobacter sp. QXT-31]|uniref:hypothetical protein n=1 Tax=Arthrobacter sp. QXT-31 TaxID=1357915 RepID=UPI0009718F0A|nr:hypothetical protein [Arthrobacter sp. QXT-31]APX04069.1 hypothetical protein BWQ92_22135 [Arthrobacter sp. QXT-31]